MVKSDVKFVQSTQETLKGRIEYIRDMITQYKNKIPEDLGKMGEKVEGYCVKAEYGTPDRSDQIKLNELSNDTEELR